VLLGPAGTTEKSRRGKKALAMNAINPDKSWRAELWLAGITVFYNIGEGEWLPIPEPSILPLLLRFLPFLSGCAF
jgi:hypothetical protein